MISLGVILHLSAMKIFPAAELHFHFIFLLSVDSFGTAAGRRNRAGQIREDNAIVIPYLHSVLIICQEQIFFHFSKAEKFLVIWKLFFLFILSLLIRLLV